MRKIEEPAIGLRVVDVRIYRGDIAASVVHGSMLQLEWSGEHDEEPVIERRGDTLVIAQRGERPDPPRLNLRLALPPGAEVIELRTGNGRVEAEGLRARLVCQSGNGDITLRAAGGDATLDTGNGKVSAFDVSGKLRVRSGNGDVVLQSASGDAALNTGNGRVEVIAARSLVLAVQSGHGDIHIGDGAIQRLDAETGAGGIAFSADLGEGEHRVKTGKGDINMRAVRGSVELRTGAGRIAASDTSGRLKAHTGHGDIVLQSATGQVELHTNAGRIEVKVPRELHLRAGSGNGDIVVGDGSVQQLELQTNRGSIHCAANLATATHTVKNGHGDVHLRRVSGDATLSTGSGRIEVHELNGKLAADSGNGDVLVRSAAGEAELTTNNGRIEVAAPRELQLQARSGHGDVLVREGSVRALQLDTKMGAVKCSAELVPGRHELASGHGDIVLKLHPDIGARLDAQTGFGQVHSDFALVRVGRSGSMSFNGSRMVGSIGAGEPVTEIVLRTGRGKIEIRRDEEGRRRHTPIVATVAGDEPPGSEGAQAEDGALEILRALARGDISVEEADVLMQGTA